MSLKHSDDNQILDLRKIFLVILAAYVGLVIAFYFLAGNQLRFRESRGDIEILQAEAGTVELVDGSSVEQIFTANIQRLQSVSVQFGTYYRANSGTVYMELYRLTDGILLMRESYDAATIGEGQIITMSVSEPIEDAWGTPLLLRVTADSQPGSAVSPLMNLSAEAEEGFSLALNGEAAEGTLCFSAAGTDYIWTGLHYWQFVAAFGLLIAAVFAVVLLRVSRGKRSYIANALTAVKKYRFLIRQLVNRDFKTKYKRSVLGMFWSFLNPLLTMLVQYFVFSTLFQSNIPNYPAYLLTGIVFFNFFSEACGMTLSSVIGNASLITKVYMPKYIYPLTRTMSSVVNLAISLIPMIIVCLITGVQFKKSAVLALYFMACLIIFSLGLGMLLATSMVFFRDTQFLWGVVSMMWMYATPIFYPESIIPENMKFIHTFNPLYHFLQNARMCILSGLSPEPVIYMQCLLIALGMLLVGAAVFYKNQDKFVLYL